MLNDRFFNCDPQHLAKKLLGKVLRVRYKRA